MASTSCLAKGDKCGAHAARSYCSHAEFAQATAIAASTPTKLPRGFPKAAPRNDRQRLRANTSPLPCQRLSRQALGSRGALPTRAAETDVSCPEKQLLDGLGRRSRLGRARLDAGGLV